MEKQSAAKALLGILDGMLDTIKSAGDLGCPEGPMYAAMMHYGCSLSQFQSLIGILVKSGKVRKSGNLLFSV